MAPLPLNTSVVFKPLPAVIVVGPWKVFTPVRISVPPVMASPPPVVFTTPPESAIIPPKVLFAVVKVNV